MEDDVVDFVVAVDEGRAVLWLGAVVAEEGDHVVLMGDFADGFAGFFVFGGSLGLRDCVEGCDLAGVEAGGFSVGGEVYGGRGYAVEFCEGGDGGVPPTGRLVNVRRLKRCLVFRAYIFVRSSGVTSGRTGSSKMRPSRNSIM